ncbi:glycosyltransferase family 4 protein [Clostridium estertheticum]|uniref:Uncharacterized protein n=1 Tax=Clostridium estertheticum subsp. estertheticum TaxID=1552 RepID=A0A1J0GE77_9CLOT|nr:glycosyltransferase family 4 protein [Clostridium estertheticum]APC39660.1 hypothetical protein A7L45_06060 [Clostridium estertheticum subsp. estertheticum]MBZ9614302.1 glycosyltransferase family 4 protein [Clostridium estertheticum subsp. laramiense]WAG74240.1 glycosyltransferase family 4 protein [Clostridium estertheticum]
MEQVYMPLKEYYEKYLKEAKDNNFIWVLSLLSREADTTKVYQDIEEKWASINDLTNDRILFVFSARDMELSTVLPTKECSWKGYINPFMKIFRNNKIDGQEYKYDPKWVCKAPKSNLADLHSRSISDMVRYLGISENDIPCLIFTNLLTNKKFIVRISDTFDVYEFIKEFVICQEKISSKYDDINSKRSYREFINGYYKYLGLVDELEKISNGSGECIRGAIQHVLDGGSYKDIKNSVESECLREKLKKYQQWKRQFYDKYITNEDYIQYNKELITILENMDKILIQKGATELFSKGQIEKKGAQIDREKSYKGEVEMNKYYIFIADGWGPKYGGINTVNYNFCRALAISVLSQGEPHVICMTCQVNRDEIAKAEVLGIKLISMTEPDLENAKVLCDELIRQGIVEGEDIVWIGHDVKTGEIALQCKKIRDGKFVLFHHMNYEEYYALKAPYNSEEYNIKIKEQVELCNKADKVIAVGPKLYKSAISKTEEGKVHMIIPGLEDINEGRHAENKHKAITFGRVEKGNDIIKQITLAVCAYAKVYKERRTELFDTLGHIQVIGYDEKPTEEQINELRELGNKYGESAFTVTGMKYQENREELFNLLRNSGFCMMLSLTEGFGLVGLEAISAGLPLICTKKSGLYDFLDSKEMNMSGNIIGVDIFGSMGNGESVNFKQDDLDNVIKAIIDLLSHYDKHLAKVKALKEEWQKKFTWERAVKEFVLLLR